MKHPLLAIALLSLALPATAGANGITQETLTSQGKPRSYYLYVPKTVQPGTPAPLLLLLHGSGRNGRSLVEKWTKVAEKEGIILVGPDSMGSKDSKGWSVTEDPPEFLDDVIKALGAKYPVNPRRVYLFGHSAGAGYALILSLIESEYFAATTIHAGALPEGSEPRFNAAKRKMPIFLIVGTNDALFPVATVRATRDAFTAQGFPVELKEIVGHDHGYYDRSMEINKMAWDFLKRHELEQDPIFQPDAGRIKVKIKRTVPPAR